MTNKSWNERVVEMLAQNMNEIEEAQVRSAREKIKEAATSGKNFNGMLEEVLNFALTATQYYNTEKYGKITTSEVDDSTWFIIYEDDFGELLADAFLMYYDLCRFAESPREHVPEGARLHTVNIFGFKNDLLDDIAPGVARLLDVGVEKVWYYDWLEYAGRTSTKSSYGRCDITKIIRHFVHIGRNRFAFEEYKNKILKERDNVMTMDDLKFLQKINRLSWRQRF